MSAEVTAIQHEVLKTHLNPDSFGLIFDPYNSCIYIPVDGTDGLIKLNNVEAPPAHIEYQPRSGNVALTNVNFHGTDLELANVIALHYLTGDIPVPLVPIHQSFPPNRHSRSLNVADKRSGLGDVIVLSGTHVHLTEDEVVQVSLPDRTIKHCDVMDGDSKFNIVDPKTGQIIALSDDEILGGFSRDSHHRKAEMTSVAPLFTPGEVTLPEILLTGNLVEIGTLKEISGVLTYRRPQILTFNAAVRAETEIMIGMPESAPKISLCSRMLYHLMNNMRSMHRKEVSAEELRAVLGDRADIQDAVGIVHMMLHGGNWGVVFDQVGDKVQNQGKIFMGDWETAYFGPAMRPELQVHDLYTTIEHAIDYMEREFKGIDGSDGKIINILLYGLLGLKGTGIDKFNQEYMILNKRLARIRSKIPPKTENEVKLALRELFWQVCEEEYGYDPFKDYLINGNKQTFGGAIEYYYKQNRMPEPIRGSDGILMIPVRCYPGSQLIPVRLDTDQVQGIIPTRKKTKRGTRKKRGKR